MRRKWHLSLRGDQDSDESDTDAGTLSSTRRPPGTSGNVMTWYSMSKPGNRNLVLRVFGARLGGILLPVSWNENWQVRGDSSAYGTLITQNGTAFWGWVHCIAHVLKAKVSKVLRIVT
jgi:hypothetical protein